MFESVRAGSFGNRAGWEEALSAGAERGYLALHRRSGRNLVALHEWWLSAVDAVSTMDVRTHWLFTGASNGNYQVLGTRHITRADHATDTPNSCSFCRGFAPLKRKDFLRSASARIPPCVFTPLFLLQLRESKHAFPKNNAEKTRKQERQVKK